MKTPISKITWTRESIAAWRKSVQHWRRMATGKQLNGEGISYKYCNLCSLFLADGCECCPVKQRTGQPFCANSPWQEASDAKVEYDIDSPQFLAAARKELAFLESLRPSRRGK